MQLNTIYNENCLEGMKRIPDQSVDAIICDLPYGTTQNKWDCVIPFEPLWEQYLRVIKGRGAIILFSQEPFTSALIVSQIDLFRYQLIWEKTKAGGFLNARRMPLQAHEQINVFYKNLPTYNPQMVDGEPYIKKYVTNGDGKCYGKFERKGNVLVNNGERFPRSILRFPNGNNKSIHPTQKPVDLLRYLIRTYTNEGEVILDNCMGSGTTAIAAMREKRNFIGFELDKEYYDLAMDRIEKERQQMTLF